MKVLNFEIDEINFYPRPPRGGRRGATLGKAAEVIFLSTPSARRATLFLEPLRHGCPISIHALREEGDIPAWRDPDKDPPFLSTPSARRATFVLSSSAPRPTSISIHALREEGDVTSGAKKPRLQAFLSTPSARRATENAVRCNGRKEISLHALREEGDHRCPGAVSHHRQFYPRPPRGGRPRAALHEPPPQADFYPRPPRGGRRKKDSDLQKYFRNFYPRPPRGGRLVEMIIPQIVQKISIHALREEGDPPGLCCL